MAGGHRLNGRWGFASGCDHAQWVLLGSMAKTGGAPESRMFLLPISQVEIIDDWHVMGLCGTGSKSIAVKDVVRFERELLSTVRAKHADILDAIRTDKELKKDTDAKLADAIAQFVKVFS